MVSDLDRILAYPGAAFLLPEHNLLGLMAFEPPYDQLYWLCDREWWEDNYADESGIRRRHGYMLF